MQGFLDASREGRHYQTQSTFELPTSLPQGLEEGLLDD